MNEQQKHQMGQVILLIVLLGGLAFSIVFMLKQISPQPKKAGPAPAAGAAEPAPGVAEPGATATKPAAGAPAKKLTGMPAEVPGGTGSTKDKSLGTLATGQLDPGMFKIYSLNPPRNPFAMEERWFAPVLAKELPGYPQLKDSKYFESTELFLPDVWSLFPGRQDWQDVEVNRGVLQPVYQLKGDSEDKQVTTNITLTAPAKSSSSAYEGAPTHEMTSPNWSPPAATGPGTAPAGNGDLFQEPGADNAGEQGLPVPGRGEELPRTGSPPPGDSFNCQGVTHRGNKAYALMSYNGQPFIVQEGTVLPPYYSVFKIQDDGVVMRDRRDESSKWIPLTAGGATTTQAPDLGGSSAGTIPAPDAPFSELIQPLVQETLQQLFPQLLPEDKSK